MVEEKYKTTLENKIKSYGEKNKLFLYKNLKLSLNQEFYFSKSSFVYKKGFYKTSFKR